MTNTQDRAHVAGCFNVLETFGDCDIGDLPSIVLLSSGSAVSGSRSSGVAVKIPLGAGKPQIVGAVLPLIT